MAKSTIFQVVVMIWGLWYAALACGKKGRNSKFERSLFVELCSRWPQAYFCEHWPLMGTMHCVSLREETVCCCTERVHAWTFMWSFVCWIFVCVLVVVRVVNAGLSVWCVCCSLRIFGDHSSGFAREVSEGDDSLYLKQSADGLPSKTAW